MTFDESRRYLIRARMKGAYPLVRIVGYKSTHTLAIREAERLIKQGLYDSCEIISDTSLSVTHVSLETRTLDNRHRQLKLLIRNK